MTSKKLFATILISLIFFSVQAINPLLKSLILPGWGELSLNSKTGFYLLGAEIATWSGVGYFTMESTHLKNESILYAQKFGGISVDDSKSFVFELMRKYNSSDIYNETIIEDANNYSDDEELQQQYIQEHLILEEWSWESRIDRNKFSDLLRDKDKMKDKAKAISGVIIVNRLVSMINVIRLNKKQKIATIGFSLNHSLTPIMNFSHRF